MENLNGKQLGQYQLVSQLGRGGMAVVYKAYQPSMDRYVALKILPRDYATDPDFSRRFGLEAKVIAALEHPHILPVYDYGEAEGYTFLVMRYLEGGTLGGIMQGRPLDLPTMQRCISQVADALDYAHSRGVVHRDIKPNNVLLDARGNCLLSDFGIAKILQSSAHYTSTGAFIGTPAYASPEQCMGEALDGRSDIYSLGVILYEMATGRPPFSADTPMAVVIKQISDPLPLPRSVNPSIPEPLERVILKALAKRPNDRFETAGEMALAITHVASGKALPENLPTQMGLPATRIEPPSVGRSPSKTTAPRAAPTPTLPPAPSNRLPAWLLGAAGVFILGLCGVAVLAGGWWLSQQGVFNAAKIPTPGVTIRVVTAPPEATEAPSKAAPPASFTPTAGVDVSLPPTWTPEAPLVVLPSDTPSPTLAPSHTPMPSPTSAVPLKLAYLQGPMWDTDIYVMNADGSQKMCVACEPCDEAEPAWSPDGQYIVYQSNCGGSYDLWKVSVFGGSPIQITFTGEYDEREPDWFGNQIVYRRNPAGDEERARRGDLRVVDPNGFNDYSLGIEGRGPSWSPDGRLLAFMSDLDKSWQVYVYTLADNFSQKLTACTVNCRWPDWSPDGASVIFNTTPSLGSADPDQIWIIPIQGGKTFTVAGGGIGRPSWSDSGWVAFNSGAGIEVVRADGSERQVLIPNKEAWLPVWSR
jgi:serine/threonine protein kinase